MHAQNMAFPKEADDQHACRDLCRADAKQHWKDYKSAPCCALVLTLVGWKLVSPPGGQGG